MNIKLYDAVRQCIRAQINFEMAQRTLADPANADNHGNQLKRSSLSEVMYMSMGIMARLDVINDPMNDQAQAAARELVSTISRRLDIDAEDRFGVPLKLKDS